MPGEEASCRHPSKSSIVFLPFQQKKKEKKKTGTPLRITSPLFPLKGWDDDVSSSPVKKGHEKGGGIQSSNREEEEKLFLDRCVEFSGLSGLE